MIDINAPLIIDWFVDETGRKVSKKRDPEEYKVVGNKVFLLGIPDYFYKVKINGMTEVFTNNTALSPTEFRVDYSMGEIAFNSSMEGQNVLISQWYSKGNIFFPAKRVYTESVNGVVTDTLESVASRANIAMERLDVIESDVVSLETQLNTLAPIIEADITQAEGLHNTLQNDFTTADTKNTNLTNAINTATTTNTTLNNTISTANTTKTNLDTSITSGNTIKTNLDTSISTGSTLKTNLDTNISTGNTLKTNLDASIATGNTLKTNLGASIATGVDTKTDLEDVILEADSINTTLNGSIVGGNNKIQEMDSKIAEVNLIEQDLLNTNEALSEFTPYNDAVDYVVLNRVSYLGSSYECISPCRGVTPPLPSEISNANWLLIAAKGLDGLGSVRNVYAETEHVTVATSLEGEVTVGLNTNTQQVSNHIQHNAKSGIMDIIFD